MKDAERPGQITATKYTKEELEEFQEGLEGKVACDCGDCPDCDECTCKAEVARDRLRKQNSLITRLDTRVLRLLEKAVTS